MKTYIKQQSGTDFVDIETTYGVVIFNINGLYDTEAKDYYSYDWAKEDGVDVYVPLDRKVKSSQIEMRGYVYDEDAMTKYITFRDFLLAGAICTFYDDIRLLEASIVLEKMLIEVERPRDGKSFVQFKMTFTNINGKTTAHVEAE